MPNPSLYIIGAGPAGLACAREAVRRGLRPVVLEKDPRIGGIARTEHAEGCLFDLGGHRFFTKDREIQELWQGLLGADFLLRPRLSRIYYGGKFYDYPLRLGPTLHNLGFANSAAILASYLWAQVHPYPHPTSFERWVTNRFGRRLYETFFRSYTEKVWGMPCTEISADWAAQRIRGLNLREIIRSALGGGKGQHASLIEQFHYPRLGPSMMWERMAEEIRAGGGEVRLSAGAGRIEHEGGRVVAVEAGGERLELGEGALVSSAPLRETVLALDPAPPAAVAEAAGALRYRGFLTVALLVDAADLFPDNWIYIHEPAVLVGRIQNPKNWSPEMVPDPGLTCLVLEYFCWPGDELWSRPDAELLALAEREVRPLGLLHAEPARGGAVARVAHAYPVYDPGYQARLRTIREYLAGFSNFQVIGRAGMHRYNNMDHSMLTGILAARNLMGETHDLWQVNLDEEYLEVDKGN